MPLNIVRHSTKVKGLWVYLAYSQKTNGFIGRLPQYPPDLISESYSMFHTPLFLPLPIRIANKASLITSGLPSITQTVHYSHSRPSKSSEAEGLVEESCLLKSTPPSFEVNILRKVLSYSPR